MINEIKEKLEYFEKAFLIRKLLESSDSNAQKSLESSLVTAKLLFAEELDVAIQAERIRLEDRAKNRLEGYKKVLIEDSTKIPIGPGIRLTPVCWASDDEIRIIVRHRQRLLETKEKIEKFLDILLLRI